MPLAQADGKRRQEVAVFTDGGFASRFRQFQEIGSRINGLADELRGRRVKGAAGGGMVEIELNGLVEVVHVSIDPSLASQGDRELLEQLVASAMTQAVGKAKQLHADVLREVTGGLPLPGLNHLLGKFLNPGSAETSDQEAGGQTREGV